jgi:hypothetical protein
MPRETPKIVGAFLTLNASVDPTLAHPVCHRRPRCHDHERREWVDEQGPVAAGAP